MSPNRLAFSRCMETKGGDCLLQPLATDERYECSSHLLLASCRIAFYVFSVAILLLIAGCRQDLRGQSKIITQQGSPVLPITAEPGLSDTAVARGLLRDDTDFYTGVAEGANGYREE